MLQNGPSRELLELWAPDPRNGLIVTGYSVEGTMARVSADSSFFSALSMCLFRLNRVQSQQCNDNFVLNPSRLSHYYE